MRLQVLLDDTELRSIRSAARRHRMTTSAWVRETLRARIRDDAGPDTRAKLDTIRAAARHAFPVAGIQTILAEIERGYVAQDTDEPHG
jgi:hypothetical protein